MSRIHQDDPEKNGDDEQRNIVKPMSKTTVIARHEAIPNYVGLSMSGIAPCNAMVVVRL
jgi:hypothetical protein